MIFRLPILLFFLAALPAQAASVLPETFGTTLRMDRAGEIRKWPPETMYEHVNGEAELLKRYGAVGLSYALYEGAGEATLSVDLIDLGASLNAFGLLALYTGCDGSLEEISGTWVSMGTFTSYARRGPYFIRVDVDAADGASLTREFLRALSGALPAPEPLPRVLGVLQQAARSPCDVGYHPEDVDYDLEAGPGYIWAAPEGQACFMRVLPSPGGAEDLVSALAGKNVKGVVASGRTVAWSREPNSKTSIYLKETLGKVAEEDE
jgi:hypothetical protein